MNSKVAVFKDTGGPYFPIVRVVSGPIDQLYIQHSEEKGERFTIAGSGDVSRSTHCVRKVDEHVVCRSPAEIRVDVLGMLATLYGVPPGSTVKVNGSSSTIEESAPLTVEFDIPGAYIIKIDPPVQYRAQSLEVTVGDA